ncbi:MAG TPA: hypothetical protein PKI30_06895 [Bacillota bacterium]|nr:hypothetical protein [Bacillota bacterium]
MNKYQGGRRRKMDNAAGIRHLYACPSCQEETWHHLSVLSEDRWGLTCLTCGVTSLLTGEQYLEAQSWEELDDAMDLLEKTWQSMPESPLDDED